MDFEEWYVMETTKRGLIYPGELKPRKQIPAELPPYEYLKNLWDCAQLNTPVEISKPIKIGKIYDIWNHGFKYGVLIGKKEYMSAFRKAYRELMNFDRIVEEIEGSK